MADPTPDGRDERADSAGLSSMQPPSTQVALRLSAESGKAIDELHPLADSIDPEALDALFAERPADGAVVRFRHDGYEITVTGPSDVVVQPIDGE